MRQFVVPPEGELTELTRLVIGAALEVHRNLGPGLLESIYEAALCVELALRQIPYARQVPLNIRYKRHSIGELRLDLLVDGKLIVELKTVDELAPIHVAQVLSYLKVSHLRLGLLINFKAIKLREGIKRVING